jgi:hypothetical protein
MAYNLPFFGFYGKENNLKKLVLRNQLSITYVFLNG